MDPSVLGPVGTLAGWLKLKRAQTRVSWGTLPRGCPGRVLELRQREGQEVPELSEQGGPGGIAETKMGCWRGGG